VASPTYTDDSKSNHLILDNSMLNLYCHLHLKLKRSWFLSCMLHPGQFTSPKGH